MKNNQLGTGILFSMAHFKAIEQGLVPIDWLELISDHFLVRNKRLSLVLESLKARHPLTLHGVGLGIGSASPLDFDYLSKIKELADEVDAPWVSEHIAWGQVPGAHFHELLPLPHTQEVAQYVIQRARIVQDFLERPFALENISSYVQDENNEMDEWEFCSKIVEESNTYMILDVNNVYVTAHNLGWDPHEYLSQMPWDRVIEIHLSGHTDHGSWIIDTHEGLICPEVWEFYRQALIEGKQPATLVEYADQSLEEITEEVSRAREMQKTLLKERVEYGCT